MPYTAETDNSADILDSRDIEARIDELEARLPLECDCSPQPIGTAHFPDCSALEPLDEEEQDELRILKDFREECENYTSEWSFGATIIRDSYFIDYAEQLADDIGAIDRNASWPICHIDWEAAAESLKQDYSSVTYDGVDYWIR